MFNQSLFLGFGFFLKTSNIAQSSFQVVNRHLGYESQCPVTHISAQANECIVHHNRAKFQHLRKIENRVYQLGKLVVFDDTRVCPVHPYLKEFYEFRFHSPIPILCLVDIRRTAPSGT